MCKPKLFPRPAQELCLAKNMVYCMHTAAICTPVEVSAAVRGFDNTTTMPSMPLLVNKKINKNSRKYYSWKEDQGTLAQALRKKAR